MPQLVGFSVTCDQTVFFFFLWLCWVFLDARGLLLVAVSQGYPLIAMHGPLIMVTSLVAAHGP